MKKRVKMNEQSPDVRIHNFNEVALGYTPEQAIEEASRCLQCKKPKCVDGCPVYVDIPKFIAAIREGKFDEAIAIVKETNALPAITGRVCPQETQCEKTCVLFKTGEPIAIGRLERFVADYERKKGISIPTINNRKKENIAVIGSGPAGLTCAADLAKYGYNVTVYESLHLPGGVLIYGIPEFRLPKEIVNTEIEYIEKLGVKIKCNHVIGKTISINEVKEKHSAIFIASGAGLPMFLGIPGENLKNIYSANEFLTRVNLMKAYLFPSYDTPVNVGTNIAVIGGGNVAMDSARCALRLGAERVSIVYRRTETEMPARAEEVKHAKEEGINFVLLTTPIRFIDKGNGNVGKMECIKMKLGAPDESGRRRPIPIENSNFVMDVDTVIIAIGQRPNPLIPREMNNLNVGKHGNIIVDEKCRTNVEGIFAGGDIATGAATVISAMGMGKNAAKSIDEYISTVSK